MRRTTRLALVASSLAAALLAPASALALTDAELADLEQAPDASTGSIGETGASSGVRVFLGLAIVLAILWALHRIIRRVQRGRLGAIGGDGAMEVLSTTHLGPNRVLHLVRVGDEVLVVGATDHAISALHRVPPSDPIVEALAAREGGGLAAAPPPSPIPLRVADALRDLTAR